MNPIIIPVGRWAVTAAFAACFAIPTLSARAQISLTGSDSENLDAILGGGSTTIPAGWSVVGNGATYTVDDTGTLDAVVVTIPKVTATKKFARVVAEQ